MISTSDFRKGTKIEYKGEPCEVLDFQHVKMGRGAALVKAKLRGMKTGSIIEESFRSGEKFPPPELEDKGMQFLYEQEGLYYFMDTESYEQTPLSSSQLGDDTVKFLKDGLVVDMLYYKDEPLAVELPIFVELAVSETEPGFKGDTASSSGKPATLETGAAIKVPFHINEGDVIKVDTRTSEYIERVK